MTLYSEEELQRAKNKLCYCGARLFNSEPCINCKVINKFLKRLKLNRIDDDLLKFT